MADEDVEPLLGVTALESAGIEVDPRSRDAQTAAGGPAQGASGVGANQRKMLRKG